MDLQIIENHNRGITILREEFPEYKTDIYLSSKFKLVSSEVKEGYEALYKKMSEGLQALERDIFIFCFYDYSDMSKFIDELEKEGHKNIKKSDMYIFRNNEVEKIS